MQPADLLEKYDAVIWPHHGLVCSGETLDMAFGIMHTIEKAAEMLVNVMQITGGKKAQTITPDNLGGIFVREVRNLYSNQKGLWQNDFLNRVDYSPPYINTLPFS